MTPKQAEKIIRKKLKEMDLNHSSFEVETMGNKDPRNSNNEGDVWPGLFGSLGNCVWPEGDFVINGYTYIADDTVNAGVIEATITIACEDGQLGFSVDVE